LCPGGSGDPTGALAAAIQKDFGSFEAMKNQLSAASVGVQVQLVVFIAVLDGHTKNLDVKNV
jgi:superoxide dismutase